MRARTTRLLLVGVTLIALAAWTRRPVATTPNEVGAIRAARLEQNAAIARRDLARVASFWTEDVSIRAGLGRAIAGRQAYLTAFAADSTMRYVRTPSEIVVSEHWPLAYESGRWAGRSATAPAGGRPLLGGRYSAQWVKADGRWLIRSEVFVALDCGGPACGWPAVAPGR